MMNPEEILDIEEGLDFEEPQEPEHLTDLGWMGDAIVANNHRAKTIKEYRDARIEKIKATCDQKLESLTEDNNRLEAMASNVMKAHGYCYDNKNLRKYDMPDVGFFRFSVTRESVDSSEYDGLDEDGQEAFKSGWPSLFKTKTTISPDKKLIKEALSDGTLLETTAFKLKPKFEKFEFREE